MRETKNNKQKTINKKTKNLLSFIFYLLSENKGFTLIELLITIILIGIIGTLITQVFILGFRSQGKSEIMKEVKQNGDYALSVMESMIRNASDISASCNESTNQLELVNPDGLTTTFICSEDSQLASQSGFTTLPLTSSKVSVHNCSSAFRIVCPTPALNPKYVFINFSLSQAAIPEQPTPVPEKRSTIEYQSTVSLRNYQ